MGEGEGGEGEGEGEGKEEGREGTPTKKLTNPALETDDVELDVLENSMNDMESINDVRISDELDLEQRNQLWELFREF